MQARTVALAGALCLTLGWALGARFAQQAPPAGGSGPRGPRPLGVETPVPGPAPLTSDLRLKLERLPAPRPGRNPFRFRAGGAAPGTGLGTPGAEAPTPSDPLEPDTGITHPTSLALSGMAMHASADGPRYTAIISDGQGLHFAGVGDRVPGGFIIVALDDASVTLRDSSGGERTLRLR